MITKLVTNRAIEDLYSGGDKDPAPRTNVGFRTATANGIIVRHIDIENELALERFECGWPYSFLVSWLHAARTAWRLSSEIQGKWADAAHPRTVYGPNLKPGRVKGTYLLLQFIRVRKGVVAEIYVALQGKRELAIDKTSRWGWFMVEPVEYGFEWIQALIEGEHRFGGEAVVMNRHLRWRWSVSIARVLDRRDCGRMGTAECVLSGNGNPQDLQEFWPRIPTGEIPVQ